MNYVLEALDQVLTWDISDDATADAVASQAGLLAGIDTDQLQGIELD